MNIKPHSPSYRSPPGRDKETKTQAYWQAQIDWLTERFPEGKYRDGDRFLQGGETGSADRREYQGIVWGMSMKIRDCFALNPSGNINQFTDFINYIDTSSVNAGSLTGVSYLENDFPSRAQRLVKQGDILYSTVRLTCGEDEIRAYLRYQGETR